MKNLNIATFNISGGVSKEEGENYFDQEKSAEIDKTFLNEIISLINSEKIDIIAFQEIITTERIEYIKSIMDKTDLKYHIFFELSECNLVNNTDCGLAILSKYQIVGEEKLKFTNPRLPITTKSGATYYTYDKGALKAKIKIENKILNFYTCHYLPFEKFKADPKNHAYLYKELEDFLLKEKEYIIGGDFNSAKALELMPNISININFEKMENEGINKYDNILTTNNYIVNSTKTIKSKSDHYLCIANITI